MLLINEFDYDNSGAAGDFVPNESYGFGFFPGRFGVRLSSKSHWYVPIEVGKKTVHFLVSDPTPPVFDGPEDRNGTQNHDEMRFWADYVGPSASAESDINNDHACSLAVTPGGQARR